MDLDGVETSKRHKRFGRKKIVSIVVVMVLILGSLGGVLWYKHLHANPIPAAIKSQVGFTTYYPSTLPDGWKIDSSSYSVDTDVLFYKLVGPKTTIVVSTQARPKSLQIDALFKSQLTNVTQFDAPSGDGAVGTAGTRFIGSMLGNDSWVLLSPTSSDITQHELRLLIMALRS
jgi:hypothetical protein